MVEKRYDSPGRQAFVQVFERLVERAMKEYPGKDLGEIRFLLAQVFSSLVFTTIAPRFFPVPDEFQPLDSDHCCSLAEQYAGMFFKAL